MRLLAAIGVLCMVIMLAGCGGFHTSSFGHSYTTKVKNVPVNGHTITCIFVETDKGGVYPSCDWGHPR